MTTNCYTATAAGVAPGITLTPQSSPPGVQSVSLGEVGRARRLTLVPVLGARIDGGRLGLGGATKRPSIEAFQPGDAVLARVKTDQTYTRGCPGSLGALKGAAAEVARGLTAWGDAGGLGSHPDVLLAMRPGSAVAVTFSGGRRKGAGRRILVFFTGAEAPVILDPGDEAGVPYRPEQGLGLLTLAQLQELATLFVGDEVLLPLIQAAGAARVQTARF